MLISRPQIDLAQWDELISRSPQSVIYAQSFYLDIVCQDWQALICSCNGLYEIVMPVPLRRKLGCTLVYQPLFCQFLGIFSLGELTFTQAETFVKSLSRHFPFISVYCFNPENTALLAPFLYNYSKLKSAVLTTQWLDLSKNYEMVSGSYSADRQANLQKSLGEDWTIVSFNNIHPLIDLFAKNHAERIPGGVNNAAYCTLEALFNQLCKRGLTQLRYAHKNGVIHAGALLVKCGSRVIYLFNAADEEGRSGNARTFLLDQYFRQQCEKDLHFDFESPEKESIMHYYKSFGGKSVPFFRIAQNKLPFPLKQIHQLRKLWIQNHSISFRKPL